MPPEETDLIEQWRGEVALLRIQHQAELKAQELKWKRKLERAVLESETRICDWRNWRGE